ncbi:MAG: prepilin-type N-terminal cleavage/methylation domain-containing protein, partial [Lachnospiraceae bacterium]|nr:prepilin-type N-terminal cleavage/methylation domain-containing protein [Lachnospiraceae bacterium]
MKRIVKRIEQNDKGFTLVELVVVLVIMVILLSLTIFGGLAWQDWTKFKHENAVAEDIFFVAQNQLTELDNSGALEREVVRPLLANSSDDTGNQGGTNLTPNGFEKRYVLAYA